MVTSPATVHVVDDDASLRTAVGRLLRASGYEVATYGSAEDLLAHMPSGDTPGCILLDVQIPGLSGPELQERLATLGSPLPIVFLTGHGDIPTSVRTIKAGAQDFLTKPVPKDTLLKAIERAMALYQETWEQRTRLKSLRALVDTLTPRESQVFMLVVRGKMNKQIAYELGTTERTIKAHRQKVMEKIQARSLAELVLAAESLGILAAGAGVAAKPAAGAKEPGA